MGIPVVVGGLFFEGVFTSSRSTNGWLMEVNVARLLVKLKLNVRNSLEVERCVSRSFLESEIGDNVAHSEIVIMKGLCCWL